MHPYNIFNFCNNLFVSVAVGFAKHALWMFTEAVEIALMFSVYLVAGNSVKDIYMVVFEILKTLQAVDENPCARYCGTGKLMKMEV